MPIEHKKSLDPAVIAPPLEDWQSDAVKLSDSAGEISIRYTEHDGVVAAAVASQIDILDHFCPSPDSIYLAVIEHAPAGSTLDDLNLSRQGLVVLEGGTQHLARTLPGSRWTELTVPLAMLEHNQLDPEPLLRRLHNAQSCLATHIGPASQALNELLQTSMRGPLSAAPLQAADGINALVLAAGDALNEWARRPPAKADAYRAGYYRVLKRALEYIEANYAEDIGTGAIASHAACSTRQLQQAFQTLLSTTPLRYLKARRLARARQLLLHPGRSAVSIGEVASTAGFMHRGRFSAAYRQHYGELPAARGSR